MVENRLAELGLERADNETGKKVLAGLLAHYVERKGFGVSRRALGLGIIEMYEILCGNVSCTTLEILNDYLETLEALESK